MVIVYLAVLRRASRKPPLATKLLEVQSLVDSFMLGDGAGDGSDRGGDLLGGFA